MNDMTQTQEIHFSHSTEHAINACQRAQDTLYRTASRNDDQDNVTATPDFNQGLALGYQLFTERRFLAMHKYLVQFVGDLDKSLPSVLTEIAEIGKACVPTLGYSQHVPLKTNLLNGLGFLCLTVSIYCPLDEKRPLAGVLGLCKAMMSDVRPDEVYALTKCVASFVGLTATTASVMVYCRKSGLRNWHAVSAVLDYDRHLMENSPCDNDDLF